MSSPLHTAIARLDDLGSISDSPSYLVRTFLSSASLQAAGKILQWMVALGMEIAHAPDGTVRGILAGSHPTAAPLLLGSHLDTVIDAGKYAGALGIIAALETLQQEKITLPFPVQLLPFPTRKAPVSKPPTSAAAASSPRSIPRRSKQKTPPASPSPKRSLTKAGMPTPPPSATPPANAEAMSSCTSSKAAC